jgi:hypothetical protein
VNLPSRSRRAGSAAARRIAAFECREVGDAAIAYVDRFGANIGRRQQENDECRGCPNHLASLTLSPLLLDHIPYPRGAKSSPPSRAMARMPVGEVTLISVRLAFTPTSHSPHAERRALCRVDRAHEARGQPIKPPPRRSHPPQSTIDIGCGI